MAGMLPGVELARIRRISHPSCRKTREPSLYQLIEPSKAMGETALIARKKLEERLGLNTPSAPTPSSRRCGEVATGVVKSNFDFCKNGTKGASEKFPSSKVKQKKIGMKTARINCINDNEGKQQILNTSTRKRFSLSWFNFH